MTTSLKIIKNADELQEYAKKNNLRQKKKGNLILLYSPFETAPLNSQERYKSIILEEDEKDKTVRLVTVSYKRVQYNNRKLIETMKDPTYCISYEGTCVHMFFYRDKWFLSTASFIDAYECFWKSEYKSIWDLFLECIKLDDKGTEESWDIFCSKHDKNKSYNYNLVHHENKHLIDYSFAFGPEYKKLCFLFSRHNETQNIDTPGSSVTDYSDAVVNNHLKSADDAMVELQRMNNEQKGVTSIFDIRYEGIAVNDYENEVCVKITTDTYTNYYCYDKIKNPGSPEHLISLYKMNLLRDYLTFFESDSLYEGQSVLKIINTIFKSLAHDIWTIFNSLYDIENNYRIITTRTDQYKSLGKETKMVLTILRGLFKKKPKLANENFILPFLKSQSSIKIINLACEQCRHRNSDHFKNHINYYNKNVKMFLNFSD